MVYTLEKRKRSCSRKIHNCVSCVSCCEPYYEFDVNNYTKSNIWAVATYERIKPSRIKVNISATGGGGELDMDYKDINAMVRLRPYKGLNIENDNTHTFTIPRKDCYISVYMIHPDDYKTHSKNPDAWTSVSENKYIKLSRYSSYNITFSEEKVPPLSQVSYP